MRVVGGIQGMSRYYELQEWGAGKILVPGENPEGVNVPEELLKGVVLNRTPPLDPDNYAAVAQLFIRALNDSPEENRKGIRSVDANNEAIVLPVPADDDSHWIVGVPPQIVGGARVTTERTEKVRNILTGEEYEQFPPPGYGGGCDDIHSHNTMPAFFSGTDDRDDAGLPGWHLVFGNFKRGEGKNVWTWDIAISMVLNYTRYQHVIAPDLSEIRRMTPHDLIESTHVVDPENIRLHDAAWENVKVHKPKTWVSFGTGPKEKGDRKRLHTASSYGWGVEEEIMVSQQAARLREEMRRNTPPWPEDYDWLHDYLCGEDSTLDLPGQTYMFGNDTEVADDDEASACEPEHWALRYVRREIECVLDSLDGIMSLAPSEQTGREIIAQLVNSTGYLTKCKARKS